MTRLTGFGTQVMTGGYHPPALLYLDRFKLGQAKLFYWNGANFWLVYLWQSTGRCSWNSPPYHPFTVYEPSHKVFLSTYTILGTPFSQGFPEPSTYAVLLKELQAFTFQHQESNKSKTRYSEGYPQASPSLSTHSGGSVIPEGSLYPGYQSKMQNVHSSLTTQVVGNKAISPDLYGRNFPTVSQMCK